MKKNIYTNVYIYTYIYMYIYMEKQMATHSGILAWEIPWTEETGRLHIVHGVTKSWTQFSN